MAKFSTSKFENDDKIGLIRHNCLSYPSCQTIAQRAMQTYLTASLASHHFNTDIKNQAKGSGGGGQGAAYFPGQADNTLAFRHYARCCRILFKLHQSSQRMVHSRKISIAASLIMSTASAFSPATSVSFGTTHARHLPPLPLHATPTATDALSTPASSDKGLVLDRPTTIERRKQNENDATDGDLGADGNSILRIYNDDVNIREYVALCLVQVVGLCESRAYLTMQDAHHNGIAQVGEYNQEVAECYEEQLSERGVRCDVVDAGGE